MSNIVVVYHSGYGHTERVAQYVAKGANAQLLAIDADGNLTPAQWAQLDAADAIIFGSPTYMGMVSWQFKKFADASSKKWLARLWRDKLAAGFTCSANLSGDKLSTLQYFVTLAMQQGMVWVGQTAIGEEASLDRLGSHTGLMVQVGMTSPANDIPQGDLEAAAAYGKRIAVWCAKLAV